jgi:hypothetical protein
MVALVGLIHMVPNLVDHEMYKIIVFKGNQEIISQFLSLMESKQDNAQYRAKGLRQLQRMWPKAMTQA